MAAKTTAAARRLDLPGFDERLLPGELDAEGAEAGEVDGRPTETIPEDDDAR
jgi:hypothetical protein